MKRTLILSIVLFFFSVAVFAQKEDYTKEPGYFNFGDFSMIKNNEPITEITIEEPLLKMVAKMAGEKNPGLADLISSIKLIKASEYEVTISNKEQLADKIETLDKELASKKWERIVKTKSKSSYANIYVKSDGNNGYAGLVITAIEKDNKASFVNIVGNIDLATIGKLSEKFNLPAMDSLKHKDKK